MFQKFVKSLVAWDGHGGKIYTPPKLTTTTPSGFFFKYILEPVYYQIAAKGIKYYGI